jgi:hypothetical protein
MSFRNSGSGFLNQSTRWHPVGLREAGGRSVRESLNE